MLFTLSFYFLSVILVYFDCKRFLVPNEIIFSLFSLLIVFGIIEEQLTIYSFMVCLLILVFFVILLLVSKNIILGGGDIKYMMIVGLYIEPILFPLFLLISGILQTLFLLFFQKFRKRRIAPMVPAMFIAVILTQAAYKLEVYPL